MIVSILNQKGGAGKTTLAINLARCLLLSNQSVILVDSDPQGSARNWHVSSNGDLLEVVGLDRPTIDKDIRKFKLHYDWIIVDGVPQLSDMAIKSVMCSDIILIPVQPSPYDVWAAGDIVDIIKQRQEIVEGKLKAAFVVSRQIVNTVIGKEIRTILEQYEMPIFKAGTYQRVAYSNSVQGGTVFESSSKEAISEIINIKNELMEFANHDLHRHQSAEICA